MIYSSGERRAGPAIRQRNYSRTCQGVAPPAFMPLPAFAVGIILVKWDVNYCCPRKKSSIQPTATSAGSHIGKICRSLPRICMHRLSKTAFKLLAKPVKPQDLPLPRLLLLARHNVGDCVQPQVRLLSSVQTVVILNESFSYRYRDHI